MAIHSKLWRIFRAVFPVVVILGAGVVGSALLASSRRPPESVDLQSVAPLVETRPVELAPSTFDITVHGTVVPDRVVTLNAEVSGKVVGKANIAAGSLVRRGEELLRIDRRPIELEIRRLESELKQSEVDLLHLDLETINNAELTSIGKKDVEIAQREVDRMEALMQSRSASASERDQASSILMKARNALQMVENEHRLLAARKERLEAQRQLILARIESAHIDLEKTTILAPLDGIVAVDAVEVNMAVQPGTMLFEIEDIAAVEIRCFLQMEDLYWLWSSSGNAAVDPDDAERRMAYQIPHVPAEVKYRLAGNIYCWEGFLDRYEGTGLDLKTRTVACRVEVPTPRRETPTDGPKTLVRGMFVEVALKASPQVHLLQIPYVALRPNNEVWSVRDDRLHISKVSVARIVDDRVLIRADGSDLSVGEALVISPLSAPADGMAVRVRAEP